VRRLKIGDRLMRLRDEGESRRLPLVFVHGAGGSSVLWMDQVRRLQDRRRVIAPDLPGHGQSDRWHPPEEVSIAMYRDAIGTICSTLKIDKVVLIGHSMGGQVALACAAAWPERVSGLVLVGTGARIPVAPKVFTVLKDDFAHAGEWLQRVAWSPATPREVVEKWQGLVFNAEQEIAIADFRAVERFDGEPLGAKVRCPTLVLVGADDLLTPPSLTKLLTAQIRGAEQRILPQAGHMLTLEQPEAFHRSLDEFLLQVG
jgi:pimeloyl-ACP methyl ester carboxylesterase